MFAMNSLFSILCDSAILTLWLARLATVTSGAFADGGASTPDLMEILVVEDEVRLAQHISRALTEAGHEPVMVHDGETALGKADLKRYDLILLDVMLPGMDGFEVLQRLRATKIDTRVLILTARGEVSDRVTGLGLGADDYLAKPFAMQELVARVSALGRRFRRGSAHQAPNRRFGFEPGRQKTVSRPAPDRLIGARTHVVARTNA